MRLIDDRVLKQLKGANEMLASKGPTSRTKVNEAAKNIICSTCRQTFLLTTRIPALEEHAQNKHSKTLAECFPSFAK